MTHIYKIGFTTLVLALVLSLTASVANAQSATGTLKSNGVKDKNATSTEGSKLGPALKKLLTSGDNKLRDVAKEVQAVLEENASTGARAKDLSDKVEKRKGWITFLIGSSYKNLGQLRSEMVTTQNHIDRLTKALERATDSAAKAEIQAKIDLLKNTASSTEAFIKTNESKFSLFGWAVKLFNR